jgi:GWxTD domain-containing protein
MNESEFEDRFRRNGVQVMPNPRKEFTGDDPSVAVYVEIYNTQRNGLSAFDMEYRIDDGANQEVLTTYKRKISTGDMHFDRVDIPASVVPSGVYYLTVSVRDTMRQTTYATSRKRFYILNPALPPEQRAQLTEDEAFIASEWAQKRGATLALELELSDVIATPLEKVTRADLKEERAQQRYLYRFWAVRDPDPDTPENERLTEFRAMKQRADTYYKNPSLPDGWRTDRGNTLLKYSRPQQVEQFVQTIDSRPYEIWFYPNIQGGAYFYFVDRQMLGNHQLVHSTMIGEVKDEQWYDHYARINNSGNTTTPRR